MFYCICGGEDIVGYCDWFTNTKHLNCKFLHYKNSIGEIAVSYRFSKNILLYLSRYSISINEFMYKTNSFIEVNESACFYNYNNIPEMYDFLIKFADNMEFI